MEFVNFHYDASYGKCICDLKGSHGNEDVQCTWFQVIALQRVFQMTMQNDNST